MTTETQNQERKVTRHRSPLHRVVYANQIACTTSARDIRLRFGCIDSASAEEMVIEDQVDVFLGPAEALGLFELLARQLKRFGFEITAEQSDDSPPAPQQ